MWLSGSLCALTSWLFLKSFFFLTLDLTLRKNCKVGTKCSCVVFTQLSWMLTSYITSAHVSKPGNGHWEGTVTYVQTLSGWHQLFHLKSCSVPGSSPEKHITLSHQDSLVFSDLWLLLILVLHSVTFLAKDYVSVALSTVSQFTFVWHFMISLLELQIWGEHKNKRPAHHCKRSVSAQDPRD